MKQFYTGICFLFFSLAGWAQDGLTEVPEAVAGSFNHKYPNATKVSWLQDEGDVYAARFYLRGEPCTVRYDANGRWLDCVRKLTFGDLRNNVRNAFSQGPYSSWRAYEVNEIQRADKEPRYRIYIRHAQTQEEKALLYDTKGKLVYRL